MMSTQPFRLEDLMDILEDKAGLPASDRTADASLTFTEIGLDSLAFLALQATLESRYGFELQDESLQNATFREIVDAVNERLEKVKA
ncbi:acyl carrier protein [Amycolatopsis cynarae]|uniref:Acyl carrier protein n=1 Tax=Amycolatopsis cynarae TaxID=2995223 RepID=A0ABY7AV99_9PSEU|nr:acyl carrier protein [Amycolatopsis sp. HUAS 11-8]WAL63438.1 acyl carrier protein [Amycolatopsis sp. HUAS 11-8]